MTVIERTIQCTTCRGSGEMESDDSTDDCIYKCWGCGGTGKIADRRRPDPQLAGAVSLSDAEWDRIVWLLSKPTPPGPEKDRDVAIWRKINRQRGQ